MFYVKFKFLCLSVFNEHEIIANLLLILLTLNDLCSGLVC